MDNFKRNKRKCVAPCPCQRVRACMWWTYNGAFMQPCPLPFAACTAHPSPDCRSHIAITYDCMCVYARLRVRIALICAVFPFGRHRRCAVQPLPRHVVAACLVAFFPSPTRGGAGGETKVHHRTTTRQHILFVHGSHGPVFIFRLLT